MHDDSIVPAQLEGAKAPRVFLEHGIGFFPIEHHSLPYTQSLRSAVFAFQPTVICLELPACLEEKIRQTIQDLPKLHFIFCQLSGLNAVWQFVADPADARVEAFRLAQELGLEVRCVDLDAAAAEEPYQPLPDELAINQLLAENSAAYGSLLTQGACTRYTPFRRVREIVRQFEELKTERILFVGYALLIPAIIALMNHREALQPAPKPLPPTHQLHILQQFAIVPVQAEQIPFAVSELPFVVNDWEEFRRTHGDDATFDLKGSLLRLFATAAAQYEEETHEKISPADERVFLRFSRNLALLNNKLRPGIYELITAAKACMDDDYAAILLVLISQYPPCGDDARTLSDRHQSHTLYHTFNNELQKVFPLYPESTLGTLEFHFKKRKQASAQQREAWKEQYWLFSDGGICTWPDESIREEKFFELIRQRSLQQLTDEHRTTEEFQTSLQDGLDIRETIRNWHSQKIYVKKERRPPGQVGALVVVWEDKPLDDPDCWNVTLYSENEKESDISFCSTPLGEEVVGPQISVCYYNCILSVFPAQNIPDVWQEPLLQDWDTCSQLLIAAGILLSEDKFITVVAAHPPDQELREFARQNHKALLFLPLQTFGRKTLKSMRRFHVLSSRNARLWGADYIDD